MTYAAEITNEIASGNYEKRIMQNGNDEIGELAVSFNHMASQVEYRIRELHLLIDNLAHEIRTPLRSVFGYAEYLQYAKIKEEEKEEALDFIQKESKRLLHLSKMLLETAQVRNDASILGTVNLKEIMEESIWVVNGKYRDNKTEVQLQMG